MKALIIAIVTASLLLLTGPALADRDHGHSHAAKEHKSRQHHKEKRRERKHHKRRHHRKKVIEHRKVIVHKPHHKRRHRRHHRRHYRRHHQHYFRPAHYGYGYRWKRLPRNFTSLRFGGRGFYYSEGVFYRPHGKGYVVAPAPRGMRVRSLPGSASKVEFDGLSYYVIYDTYYRWDQHARNYRVVANPGFY